MLFSLRQHGKWKICKPFCFVVIYICNIFFLCWSEKREERSSAYENIHKSVNEIIWEARQCICNTQQRVNVKEMPQQRNRIYIGHNSLSVLFFSSCKSLYERGRTIFCNNSLLMNTSFYVCKTLCSGNIFFIPLC